MLIRLPLEGKLSPEVTDEVESFSIKCASFQAFPHTYRRKEKSGQLA